MPNGWNDLECWCKFNVGGTILRSIKKLSSEKITDARVRLVLALGKLVRTNEH